MKTIAQKYAERGYTGSITVTGNQYITSIRGNNRLRMAFLGGDRIRVAHLLSKERIRKEIDDMRGPWDANSWLTVSACAEGVTSILPPCKPAGSTVYISPSAAVSREAITMAACHEDGKRALQNCTPSTPRPNGLIPCLVMAPEICEEKKER
jgi:hypothetical protein